MPVNGSPQQIRDHQAIADPVWVVVDECKSKFQVPVVEKRLREPLEVFRATTRNGPKGRPCDILCDSGRDAERASP